jgi:hypothetical protein
MILKPCPAEEGQEVKNGNILRKYKKEEKSGYKSATGSM